MKVNSSNLTRKLDAARRDLPDAVTRARIEVSEDLLAKASDLIPVDEGTALASGGVDHRENESEVYFGAGLASEYIWPLHEDLEARHAPGKSAKFLSIPFAQNRDRYADYITDAAKEALRG